MFFSGIQTVRSWLKKLRLCLEILMKHYVSLRRCLKRLHFLLTILNQFPLSKRLDQVNIAVVLKQQNIARFTHVRSFSP